MKNLLLVGATLVALLGTSISEAQNRGYSTDTLPHITNSDKAGQLGVGLQVGGLSGVGIEYWLNNVQTLNAAILTDDSNTALSVSHQWMFPGAFSDVHANEALNFVPYVGVGLLGVWGSNSDYFDRSSENFAMAVQVPLGIEFLPKAQRFSIFGEIAPSIEFIPQGHGFVAGDLGARFYF